MRTQSHRRDPFFTQLIPSHLNPTHVRSFVRRLHPANSGSSSYHQHVFSMSSARRLTTAVAGFRSYLELTARRPSHRSTAEDKRWFRLGPRCPAPLVPGQMRYVDCFQNSTKPAPIHRPANPELLFQLRSCEREASPSTSEHLYTGWG